MDFSFCRDKKGGFLLVFLARLLGFALLIVCGSLVFVVGLAILVTS